MVEHRLPKPGVEGSNPFSRSRNNKHFPRRISAFCFAYVLAAMTFRRKNDKQVIPVQEHRLNDIIEAQ